MNAIRKIVQREGNELRILLPEDFKSEKFEVIILPSDEGTESKKDFDIEAYQQAIRNRWSKFSVDMTNFKFNRNELYNR